MVADRVGARQPARLTVRRGLAAAVLVAVALVAWQGRTDLAAAGRDVLTARPGWLAVLGLVLLGWLTAWAAVYIGALAIATRVRVSDVPVLASAAIAAVAANTLVTSGGLAGLPVVLRGARRRDVSPGGARSGYLLAVAAIDLGFVIVVAAGVLWVLLDGSATGPELAAVVVFAVVTVARAGLVVLALRRRELVLRWADSVVALLARVRRRPVHPIDRAAVDELVGGLRQLAARPARAVVPVLGAVVVDVCGVLLLWAAVGAVGGTAGIPVALVAYVFSSLGAVLMPLPGGLGGAELGAVAALVAGGVPLAVAAAATVLFRVAELWIPVLLGLGLGWVLTRRTPAAGAGEVAS